MGGGEGQFRPADGQLAAAVEAEPAEPEQPSAQDDLGHVMGWSPGLGPVFAGAHQAGQHQGRDPGADVHHGAASEVEILAQKAAAPNHVGQRRIHQ